MTVRLVLLVLALALPVAAAERPADFAWSSPIELDAREGLHQLELGALVHQGVMRRDLGDIRVFNAAGEVVPYAFAPLPHVAAADEAIALPFFPVQAERGAHMDGVDVKIQTRADGTVLGLSTRAPGAGSEQRIVGYLVDATAVERPLAALRLSWKPAAVGTNARIRLEASDDLQRWSVLAAGVPLIDLEFGGHRLTRDRVEFAPLRVKYLRVSWTASDPPLQISGIEAHAATVAVEPRRLWREAKGSASEEAAQGGYVYDLGGLFPVDRLRLVLPQANTVARVEFLTRSRAADPWRPIGKTVVYRLTRAGIETNSPDFALPATTERYWLVKVDPHGGGLGAGVPDLHAGWIAPRIVFAARGEAPFQLAFGNRDATRTTYAVESLVPGYKPSAPLELPFAKLGTSSVAAVPTPPADRPDYRRWSLWGVLLLAVAVLAAMAYRLVSHLRKAESGAAQPADAEDSSRPH